MSRTNIDFSEHSHRVEIFKCEETKREIRVDHFQVGGSRMNYIQFVNTDETLTVTGDFGNWVFCRPFVPSAEGGVSEQYWIEKLKNSSIQEFKTLDFVSIIESINKTIADYEKEIEEEDTEPRKTKLQKEKEWFGELLEVAHEYDSLSYLSKAYRDYSIPDNIEHEDIPCYKDMPMWLSIIFDAFDEICRRLKETENKVNKL